MVDRLHACIRNVRAALGDDSGIEAELAFVEHIRHVLVRKRVNSQNDAVENNEADDDTQHGGKYGNMHIGILQSCYSLYDSGHAVR